MFTLTRNDTVIRKCANRTEFNEVCKEIVDALIWEGIAAEIHGDDIIDSNTGELLFIGERVESVPVETKLEECLQTIEDLKKKIKYYELMAQKYEHELEIEHLDILLNEYKK